jgi:hypothetical protein
LKSDRSKVKQYGGLQDVTKGGFIVDNRPSVSSFTSKYDHFLFAPICEEANGMQLSVLSALARMDVDPWKEATRLAAMPKVIAERTLVSTLERVLGQKLEPIGNGGNCCAISSASSSARRRCHNCTYGDCKDRHATDLLVGVAGLCVSDILSIAAPSGNDNGCR